MAPCAVCFKETFFSKLTTIGGQTVCCISCVSLLNSKEKDRCNYCYRPVWKDSYYKIKNKYYCSEVCKNEIIKKLNIPNESKLIQYFHEYIFNNNNYSYNLKNSNQLRLEVLKFYKDFKFDTIINKGKDKYDNYKLSFIKNEKEINVEKEHFSESANINKYITKFKIREKNKSENSIFKITTKVNESLDDIKKKYYLTKPLTNNLNKNILKKAYTCTNINNTEEKKILKKRVKRINKEKIALYKNNYYNTIYNKNYEEGLNFSDNNIHKTLYKYNKLTQYNKNNNFDNNKNSSSIPNYNFLNDNYINNSNFKDMSFLNINKVRSIPIRLGKKKNYCLYCGNTLGNVTFKDRKGNGFCTDNCKENFLKNKSSFIKP